MASSTFFMTIPDTTSSQGNAYITRGPVVDHMQHQRASGNSTPAQVLFIPATGCLGYNIKFYGDLLYTSNCIIMFNWKTSGCLIAVNIYAFLDIFYINPKYTTDTLLVQLLFLCVFSVSCTFFSIYVSYQWYSIQADDYKFFKQISTGSKISNPKLFFQNYCVNQSTLPSVPPSIMSNPINTSYNNNFIPQGTNGININNNIPSSVFNSSPTLQEPLIINQS
ncbi:hypothetical protein WA158_004590 [Blastocystis sp. Blastoise]